MNFFSRISNNADYFYLKIRDALNTVSTKRRPSARLDLTSALDCVEAIDSNVVANLTRPLDFTHQVGAWFLEMVLLCLYQLLKSLFSRYEVSGTGLSSK